MAAPSSTRDTYSPKPRSILKRRVPPEQEHLSPEDFSDQDPSFEQADATPSLPGISRQQAARLIALKQKELKPDVPLSTYETLSVFPLSPPSSSPAAANPSLSDRTEFLSLVKTFSPSEYDDLVDERNCLNKCGYALCPRPRRSYVGEYKLHRSGVAKTADLNKWCSDECALRALHVRVQLDNPSYVRVDGELKVQVTLRPEKTATITDTTTTTTAATTASAQTTKDKPQDQQPQKAATDNKDDEERRRQEKEQDATEEKRAQGLARLDTDREEQSKKNYGTLASERNDMGFERVPVTIRDKETTEIPRAPVPSGVPGGSDAHLMVEGYKIGSKGKKPERRERKDGEEGEEGDDDSDDDDPFPTVRLEVLNYGRK